MKKIFLALLMFATLPIATHAAGFTFFPSSITVTGAIDPTHDVTDMWYTGQISYSDLAVDSGGVGNSTFTIVTTTDSFCFESFSEVTTPFLGGGIGQFSCTELTIGVATDSVPTVGFANFAGNALQPYYTAVTMDYDGQNFISANELTQGILSYSLHCYRYRP
jgi:hypothetical protein